MVNELDIDPADNEWSSNLALLYDNCIYLWEKPEDFEAVRPLLDAGTVRINAEDWPQYLEKQLMPLARLYRVDFDKTLVAWAWR